MPRLHATARAIACSLVLLALPACGIPDLRRAQPAPGLPPSFNGAASEENSSLLSVDQFYRDPTLVALIDQVLCNNRELKILDEEVNVAAAEILARSGAYLPFMTLGPNLGLDRVSKYTLEGAAIRVDPYLPDKFFTNPHGNYLLGANFTWQLDIYRQLRNARDAAAQRYIAAIERRNFYVTRLVAETAESYFRLMALDKRIENLNQIIELQRQSLKIAQARKEFARDTQLAVLRFEAELRRNESEKLVVNQDIIEVENRVNFLANRYPQRVVRDASNYFDLTLNALGVGIPSQLLQNRPDIRRAERELAAAGLDVQVARVDFYPQLVLNAGVGLQSFNMQYLFDPQAVIGNVAAGFVGPLVNRRAIRARYLANNARQLQAIYDYQRTVLDAFNEVVNRLNAVRNYSQSVALRKQQMTTLERAVNVAEQLFQNARTEYLDVLIAQRDLRDARTSLIDAKQQQLSAVVNTYQALGGGAVIPLRTRPTGPGPVPNTHKVGSGEDFRSISVLHYGSDRYARALWSANKANVPAPERLAAGDMLIIPPLQQLDPTLVEGGLPPTDGGPAPAPAMAPADPVATPPAGPPPPPPPPPPENRPGPFGEAPTPAADPAVRTTGGTRPGVAAAGPADADAGRPRTARPRAARWSGWNEATPGFALDGLDP